MLHLQTINLLFSVEYIDLIHLGTGKQLRLCRFPDTPTYPFRDPPCGGVLHRGLPCRRLRTSPLTPSPSFAAARGATGQSPCNMVATSLLLVVAGRSRGDAHSHYCCYGGAWRRQPELRRRKVAGSSGGAGSIYSRWAYRRSMDLHASLGCRGAGILLFAGDGH